MSFDHATLRVIVTAGDRVGEGAVVAEDHAEPNYGDADGEFDSLLSAGADDIRRAIPEVVFGRLAVTDGYGFDVNVRHVSQGGDGSSVEIIIRLIDGLRNVAIEGLAGLVLQALYDELRKRGD